VGEKIPEAIEKVTRITCGLFRWVVPDFIFILVSDISVLNLSVFLMVLF